MDMQSIGTLKRGDTFAFCAQLTDTNGDPLLDAENKLRSQVRTAKDVLLAELTITAYTNPITQLLVEGAYVFISVEDTSDWPTGKVYFDIQYTNNNIVVSTETVFITIVADITHE